MLLRFRVRNHLSIKEEQELSLVASSLHDHDDALIADIPASRERALPAAIIYGANASGKSNVLDAFLFVRQMVLNSHREGEPEGKIPRKPHLLDPAISDDGSAFEIDFVAEGVRYQYGFVVSNDAVLEEWLTAFPRDRAQKLFTRKKQRFEFSRLLKGRNQVISELTRPNSLFVSAGAQNDHETLSGISRYFRSWRTDRSASALGARTRWEKEIDSRVIEFLGRIGTGVVAYRKRDLTSPPEAQAFIADIEEVMKRHFKELEPPNREKKSVALELAHKARDGEQVYFGLDRESEGTRRLLLLLSSAYEAMEQGSLLLVDELDASLHTLACEQVVLLFCDRKMNKNGAQLIATTHDTNLLDSKLLRRDQVWFVEKGESGATDLYPLTDIRTRKSDNLERGYLQGRYGAVPG